MRNRPPVGGDGCDGHHSHDRAAMVHRIRSAVVQLHGPKTAFKGKAAADLQFAKDRSEAVDSLGDDPVRSKDFEAAGRT